MTSPARPGFGPATAILVGGLAASVGDFVAAMLIWKISWVTVGHAIAKGVLGPAVRDSGVGGAVLGIVLHTAILLVAAAIYVLASRRLTFLARRPFLWGPVFGAGVYLVMNYVVVPLSLARRENAQPLEPTLINALNIASHLFLVGLPIALAASRMRRS